MVTSTGVTLARKKIAKTVARLTTIVARVARATATAISTITSENVITRPGSTSSVWAVQRPTPRSRSAGLSARPRPETADVTQTGVGVGSSRSSQAFSSRTPWKSQPSRPYSSSDGQQDADELAEQELPPRHRLAHEGDGGAALDLLADRLAGGQGAEQGGDQHHGVVAEVLDHDEVFAEGEVRHQRRDHQGEHAEGEQHPEQRLADALAEGGVGDGPALGPHQHQQGEADAGRSRSSAAIAAWPRRPCPPSRSWPGPRSRAGKRRPAARSPPCRSRERPYSPCACRRGWCAGRATGRRAVPAA